MYNFKNKQANISTLNQYMYAKTLSMFEYQDLPDTIPYKELEKLIQMNGYAFITKVDDKLYAFAGGLGGEVDVYNNPTKITINNVALNFNKTLDIIEDGVLIYNDDMGLGLNPLYDKYNSLLIENDINMVLYGYNARTQKILSASDDKTKQSAENYLKKVIDGDLGVIGENAMFEGLKVQSANGTQSSSITALIEYHQYIKGSLFNEIGLNASFNMKRERVNTSEVEMNEDSLFPLVYNMMKCRLKAIEKINKMYSTDIKIGFGSVWHVKNKEIVDDIVGNKPPELNPSENLPPETKTELEAIEEIEQEGNLSDEDLKALEDLKTELENLNNDNTD